MQGQHLAYHIYIDTGVVIQVLRQRFGGIGDRGVEIDTVDTGVEIGVRQVLRYR